MYGPAKTSLLIPAYELGDSPDQRAADAYWNFGCEDNWLKGKKGQSNLALTWDYYSMPVWDGRLTTKGIWVHPSPAVAKQTWRFESISVYPVFIPWDNFKTALGTDSAVIVEDTAGVSYEIQNLRKSNLADWIGSFFKIKTNDWVADMIHEVTPACREKETHIGAANGHLTDRDGLVTVEGVATGFRYALALGTLNGQYGPGARFVAPGDRIEKKSIGDRPSYLPYGDDPRMIPRMTRFRWDYTIAEIEQMASQFSGVLQQSAYNLYEALVVYGMIDSLTVGVNPYLQCEGGMNPDTAKKWAALGLNSTNFKTILRPILQPGRLVVVNPG